MNLPFSLTSMAQRWYSESLLWICLMYSLIPKLSGITNTQPFKSPAKNTFSVLGRFKLNRTFLVFSSVFSDDFFSIFLLLKPLVKTRAGIPLTLQIPYSVSAEITVSEGMKRRCLLNNEGWRLSEGEKVVGKTNGSTPSRDGYPEGK
jgi:hypothetical protein